MRKIINTTLRRRRLGRFLLLLFTVLPPYRLHDFLLRAASRQALLHIRIMLLDETRIPTDLPTRNSTASRHRLNLQQLALAAAARVPQRINTLRMPLELRPAAFGAAAPDVLVVNLVAVLGSNVHAARSERRRALAAPGLERSAVRLVFDTRDHEVGEVAKLVSEDVEEAFFVVDDFLGEFDGGVVFLRHSRRCCWRGASLSRFAPPVGAAGGGVQCFAPDYADAACGGAEGGDLAGCDCVVEFGEEGFCESVFAGGEVLFRLDFGLGPLCGT